MYIAFCYAPVSIDRGKLFLVCPSVCHKTLTLPLKCTPFDGSFSNFVCMFPVMSSTSYQILRSIGQRSMSQGSWLKSQNYIFASKMHTFWCILQLGMHVTCDEFYILSKVKVIRSKVKVIRSKVKVTEVMAAAGALCYFNTSCFQ